MISVSLLRKTRYFPACVTHGRVVGAGEVEGIGYFNTNCRICAHYFQRFFIRCIIVGEDHFEVRVAGVLVEAVEAARKQFWRVLRRNHDTDLREAPARCWYYFQPMGTVS